MESVHSDNIAPRSVVGRSTAAHLSRGDDHEDGEISKEMTKAERKREKNRREKMGKPNPGKRGREALKRQKLEAEDEQRRRDRDEAVPSLDCAPLLYCVWCCCNSTRATMVQCPSCMAWGHQSCHRPSRLCHACWNRDGNVLRSAGPPEGEKLLVDGLSQAPAPETKDLEEAEVSIRGAAAVAPQEEERKRIEEVNNKGKD